MGIYSAEEWSTTLFEELKKDDNWYVDPAFEGMLGTHQERSGFDGYVVFFFNKLLSHLVLSVEPGTFEVPKESKKTYQRSLLIINEKVLGSGEFRFGSDGEIVCVHEFRQDFFESLDNRDDFVEIVHSMINKLISLCIQAHPFFQKIKEGEDLGRYMTLVESLSDESRTVN